MSGRATFALLLATLLLGGFIWFFERGGDTTEQQIARARFALHIQPDRITRIGIASPAVKMQFAKQGDGWHITEPLQALADDGRIEQLLAQLSFLPRSQIITEAQLRRRHQKAADYGLDQPRWRVTLGDRDSEMTLLIGRNAPTGDALYVQQGGRHDVVVTPTNMLSAMPASVSDFRNRWLVPGVPDEVVRLELRSRAGFVQTAINAHGDWQVTKPIAARADAAAVRDALRQLFAARIVDFEASSKVGASLYGFDEPSLQCSVLSRDGAVGQTMLLGKTVEGRTNLVYATKQGEEEIFTVDRGLLAALTISQDDLRDRRLMSLPSQRVTEIHVESGEQSLTLTRTNGAWFITAPHFARADARKVQLALAEWGGARVKSFNDQPGTNVAALGFSPPAARVSFTGDFGGGGDAPGTIVCEISSNAESGALRTARISGEDSLCRIDASALVALPPQPLYFRDSDVLAVDAGAVRSLAFERGGQTSMVRLDASNAPPDSAAAVLKLLQPLRAREFVTEDTRDLSGYGLQPPEATLTVGLKATGTLSRIVMVGRRAPTGGRFATIQGMDLVFTLDDADSDALWRLSATAPPHE